jgi:hypothetical protein
MVNKYQAVMDFIKNCPIVGKDLYFNFTDETNNDGNTNLYTVPYGQVVRRYVDGALLMKMQFEIRQVKPLTTYSNTTANTEQMQLVQEFLDWINEQGKKGNYPDWGEVEIVSMATPDTVKTPSLLGISADGSLYAFPFEIIYLERN